MDIYRKSYLFQEKTEISHWGGISSKGELDKLSKNILKLLAENSRTPIVELAERLNSSPKTIISKIKNLEKEKIILGYRIIIDLEKIEKENYKVLIDFNNLTKEKEEKFKDYCKNNPNIQYYIKNIAKWDVELDIEIQNFKKFHKLIKEIKTKFSNIIKNVDFIYMSEETKGELNIAQDL